MERFASCSLMIMLLVAVIGCAAQSERVRSQPRPTTGAATRTRVGVWEEQDVIYSTGIGRSERLSEARGIALNNARMGLAAYVRTHFEWVNVTEGLGAFTGYHDVGPTESGVWTCYATVRTGKPISPDSR